MSPREASPRGRATKRRLTLALVATVATAVGFGTVAVDVQAAATSSFLETFTGAPASPTPFNPSNWDITVHSRDVATFDTLEPMAAMHGADCAGPPATHTISAYADTVFLCKDHMMTSLKAEGYGMIYLTPNNMVDFSQGEAVIKFDISTLRTSNRDWWDMWITPYGENLQLPLDLGVDVDATGPPRDAIRVGLGTENQLQAQIFKNFNAVDFGQYPSGYVPGNWSTGYQTFLTPDAARRDTVEIHISKTHIKVGMPAYNFWWVDRDIPALTWGNGVVQFGHHSYNPEKDCNTGTNDPKPRIANCTANTWHWDNVSISPSIPFTIIKSDARVAQAGSDTLTFSRAAPANAQLRFAGIGGGMQVSFNGGAFQAAQVQATQDKTVPEHFASYWMNVPPGTKTVRFAATNWWGGKWEVRDATIWNTDADTTPVTNNPSGGGPVVPGPNDVVALDSHRLLDSRYNGVGIRQARTTTTVAVAGNAGIPAGSTAAVLNVTVTQPQAAGYITVYPCGQAVPATSSLNFTAGQTIANAVITKLDGTGKACVYTSQTAQIIVDASASPGTSFTGLAPSRQFDSRSGAKPGAGSVTAITVAGKGGVPSNASAVSINLTATETVGAGYLAAYPCGSAVPSTSNVNYLNGQTIANAAIVKVGTGGQICVFSSQSAHVIVDVNGAITGTAGYSALSPLRVLESRSNAGNTFDGQFNKIGRRGAGAVTELTLAGRGGVPGDAVAVALNVTATEATADGFVVAYPCGSAVPGTSNLNYTKGNAASNTVVVKLGTAGKVCIFNSQPTQLIVDLSGYFSASSGVAA